MSRTIGLVAVWWCLVALGPQGSDRPVGIVDAVSGQWIRAQDRRPLVQGELIYDSTTILSQQPESGTITIVMLSTSRPWRHTCSAQTPCKGTLRPRAEGPERESGFWAFLTSFWTPARQLDPAIMASRSAGPASPSHTLLELAGSNIDLRPALTAFSPAFYQVRLVPAFSSNDQDAIVGGIRVVGEDPIRFKAPSPALYVLTVMTEHGSPIGSNAVILVVPPDDARRERWVRAVEQTATWEDASPATRQVMLARVLYAMAEGPGGESP